MSLSEDGGGGAMGRGLAGWVVGDCRENIEENE